jgi:hypothetical protein
MVLVRETYLLPELAYPLDNALALVCSVFYKKCLSPELQAGVAVFLDDVQMWHYDASNTLGLVVPRLLDNWRGQIVGQSYMVERLTYQLGHVPRSRCQ